MMDQMDPMDDYMDGDTCALPHHGGVQGAGQQGQGQGQEEAGADGGQTGVGCWAGWRACVACLGREAAGLRARA